MPVDDYEMQDCSYPESNRDIGAASRWTEDAKDLDTWMVSSIAPANTLWQSHTAWTGFMAAFADLLHGYKSALPLYIGAGSLGHDVGVSSDQILEQVPSEVTRFCRDYGAWNNLETAIELAKTTFPASKITGVRVQHDHESGAEWLQLKVATRATVDDAMKAYDDYIREWVKKAPSDARRLVRLSFKCI